MGIIQGGMERISETITKNDYHEYHNCVFEPRARIVIKT